MKMHPRWLTVVPLLFATSAAAEPAGPVPLAHWSFEAAPGSSLMDSVAQLTGTLQGKPESVPGVEGRAWRFDDAVLAVPDAPALHFPEATFSVTAWANPYDLSLSQQMILAKNDYSAGQREWGLMLDKDNRFRFYLRQNGWKTLASRTEPKPGQWSHLAVTLEKGNAHLYVNGKLEAEGQLAATLPSTTAPLTIGGGIDGGRITQAFYGALDEVALYRTALPPAAVRSLANQHPAPHPVEIVKPVTIWGGNPVPKSADLPAAAGVEFSVIKRHEPEQDGYPWLHGVGLAWHKGKLYASFGHNRGEENTATEEARGRVSEDGGKTWSDVFTIDTGTDAPDLAVSHGVFLSTGQDLWAFHGAFSGKMGRIHTRAYLLDEAANQWRPKGIVIENGFWPLNQPVRMADGHWILAGISAGVYSEVNTNPPAVAISHGDDFTRWDFIAIQAPQRGRVWGESALIVDGPRICNLARYGGKALALAAFSEDFGRTWTPSTPSNLPMATSKPCAGMLSTGQRYLVCTTTADSGGRRSPLTIAVSAPGGQLFDRIFVIRPAVFPGGPGESHERASLSYPCAIEHAGKLYVGYSNSGGRGGNHNSAELAVIPISALKVEINRAAK